MECLLIFVSVVSLLWFASLCKLVYVSFYPYRTPFVNNDIGSLHKRNVLLVIAHPDDESMFFSPTINHLTSRGHNVRILCLSTGNADGIGDVRKKELYKASSVLKVPPQQVTVMDHPDFQDGFGKVWDSNMLSKIVEKEVRDHAIDMIITFDNYGVSGHCNHRDVHHGVQRFVLDTSEREIEAWELAITESCLPVLPHILCEYLYDLSKNFNSVCEVGFVSDTTKLLLCEATGVLLEKCFQLLGITPVLSSQEFLAVDWPEASSLGLTKSLLQVERLNFVRDPPKTTNARFELLSVYPHITGDPSFRKGNMFGQIEISDTYNLLSDGWGLTSVPDHGFVSLFDCDWYNSVDITNHWPVYLGDPSSRRLVPFSSFMEIRVELYASTEESDAFFELYNSFFQTDLEEFWEDEADTRCDVFIRHGKDGHIGLYYILLKDAIHCAIKVTYVPKKHGNGEVFAEIFAYPSSDFFDKQDPLAKNYYTPRLFRSTFDPHISEIPLERSMLAIPANGSVVIEACLWDADSGVKILDGSWTFHAGFGGEQKIDVPCGSSLRVSVDWSRG